MQHWEQTEGSQLTHAECCICGLPLRGSWSPIHSAVLSNINLASIKIIGQTTWRNVVDCWIHYVRDPIY